MATQAAIHPMIRRMWNTLWDDAAGARSRKTNMEINKNKIFNACGWVQIYGTQPSSSGDCVLPLLNVVSVSAGISLISGLQHQAWCCKVLMPGVSNGPGWDKYTGCEMKSILMSLSVQSVLKLFLQNEHCTSSFSPEARSFLPFLFSQWTWSHLCHALSASSSSSL